MSIIGDGIMLGAGGETASIFVTGLSDTDTVTATKDGKTVNGKWVQKPNPKILVPNGYTQLTHIEFTGVQRIDTGVLDTDGFIAEMTISFTQLSETEAIIGSWQQSPLYRSYLTTVNTNRWQLGAGSNWYAASATGVVVNEEYNITVNTTAPSPTLVVNGSQIYKGEIGSYTHTGRNIYIGALNANGSIDGTLHAKVCPFKLYDHNYELVRDYVPVVRNSDANVGLYDLAHNQFYTNVGTGEFVAGTEIPKSIDGFLIDKIKDYGTWTVTATDGTNTATSDVVVDSAIEYSVEMSYVSWLYKDGNECEYVTGGWVNGGYNGGAGTFSKDDDHLTVKHAGNGAQLARTSNKIDLTPYNTVFAEVITSTDNYSAVAIRVKDTPDYNDGSEGTVTEGAKLTVKTIIQTDVSTLSGEYYIKPAIYWGSYAYFYKIWLE